MLTSIKRIKNVGLFTDYSSCIKPFGKMVEVYGENGRGKTTICSILRSLSRNDSEFIEKRKTIGSTERAQVELEFSDGEEKYYNGKWENPSHKFEIFDSEFVKESVYVGDRIEASQRQNLFAFALGERAVSESRKIDQLKRKVKESRDKVKSIEDDLNQICNPPLDVSNFNSFEKSDNIENDKKEIERLRQIEKNIDDAEKIRNRKEVSLCNIHKIDLEGICDLLASSLDTLSVEAAKMVHKWEENQESSYESWLRRGLNYCKNGNCPFCHQPMDESSIVDVYKAFFDDEYAKLADAVSELIKEQQYYSNLINSIPQLFNAIRLEWNLWQDVVPVEYSINTDRLKNAVSSFSEFYFGILTFKKDNILQSVEKSDLKQLGDFWHAVLVEVDDINSRIREYNNEISRYKKSLSSEQREEISAKIINLSLKIKRAQPDVIDKLNQWGKEKAVLSSAETALSESRDNYRAIMSDTLVVYKDIVNDILSEFSAPVSIGEMKPNFRGNAPQSQFVLELDGHDISLKPDDVNSFDVTLSEGDKRSLAIAFFFAKLRLDNQINSKMVIFDDPITSFDEGRRFVTYRNIAYIAARVSQVFVFSHDKNCLRDLKLNIRKYCEYDENNVKNNSVQRNISRLSWSTFKIVGSERKSSIVDVDLDDLCSSQYQNNINLIKSYLNGESYDYNSVALAIRPTLESYLKRRFSPFLEGCDTLSQMESRISEKDYLQNVRPILNDITELRSFGNFRQHGKEFDPGVSEPTVRRMAQRLWNLIFVCN